MFWGPEKFDHSLNFSKPRKNIKIAKITTCPKFESNNIVVYEDIRNGVVFAGNICSQCGCIFGAS